MYKTQIVASLMLKNLQEISDFDLSQLAGADLIEWRADALGSVDSILEAAAVFFEKFQDWSVIFTVRTTAEGGKIQLNATDYAALLKEVIANYQPEYTDMEYFQAAELLTGADRLPGKLIASFHDFHQLPEDLEARLTEMAATKPDIVKVAVSPKTTDEVLQFMQLAEKFHAASHQPLIAIAMSEIGQLTRIAGQLTSSIMTFASLPGEAAAPGQLTIAETRTILDILEK